MKQHAFIPMNLPHACRVARRLLDFLVALENHHGRQFPKAMQAGGDLVNLLIQYDLADENPPAEEARKVAEQVAARARELVAAIEEYELQSDRMGQWVRNLFECLEKAEEGLEISLRAGENPKSLQRPA
ncbi:MAG: hypothetical protein PWP23_1763 [Candidatus Sumerlaeota bacterium]|nr:hypothetical protein [Candidatus Sumerlaeota bacterium]